MTSVRFRSIAVRFATHQEIDIEAQRESIPDNTAYDVEIAEDALLLIPKEPIFERILRWFSPPIMTGGTYEAVFGPKIPEEKGRC